MIYKRGKWYHLDDTVNGVRYREPLKTTNWQEALRLEKERLGEIAAGKGLNRHIAAKQTFNQAADSYIEKRKLFSAEKTYLTDKQRSGPLRRFFGETRLKRITGEMVEEYQTKRAAEGMSGRTVNLEVGLFRRILKRGKQWTRIAEDVEMLPEQPRDPRILLPEEKSKLLATAASKPQWQVAHCAAVVALNTTMRSCELKGLHWKNVDLFENVLRIRRQSTKTDAGERVIPLNRDAVVALGDLWDRCSKLGSSEPDHFVFPACENGHIDPTRPMKGWRSAWRSLTKAAGLKGLRFHDLRHQASRSLAKAARAPDHHEHRRTRLPEYARSLQSHPARGQEASRESPRDSDCRTGAANPGTRRGEAQLGGSSRGLCHKLRHNRTYRRSDQPVSHCKGW
jgi:integrase